MSLEILKHIKTNSCFKSLKLGRFCQKVKFVFIIHQSLGWPRTTIEPFFLLKDWFVILPQAVSLLLVLLSYLTKVFQLEPSVGTK